MQNTYLLKARCVCDGGVGDRLPAQVSGQAVGSERARTGGRVVGGVDEQNKIQQKDWKGSGK